MRTEIVPSAVDPTTLVDILRRRAIEQRNDVVFIHLVDGEQVAIELTFGELWTRACAIAVALRARGLGGERALLVYPPGLEFAPALFGCFLAGVIAVPASGFEQTRRSVERLEAIVRAAAPKIVLTVADVAHVVNGVEQLATNQLPLEDFTPESIDPEALAYLQYTSGSTAEPRGVMLSHANLWWNCFENDEAYAIRRGSTMVCWVPPFHDMGLSYGVMIPVFGGARCVSFAADDFLRRPIRWLRAISHYRATHSVAPNAAYDLAVTKTRSADREGLDLSSWQMALNGSEPIRREAEMRFLATYAPFGFRAKTFSHALGMAECTALVSAEISERMSFVEIDAAALNRGRVLPAAEKSRGLAIASCGVPSQYTRVRAIDPETCRPVAPGQIGELWIQGPSVGRGYFHVNGADESESSGVTFGARIEGEDAGIWLRTGDLGFVQEGRVYVTGRLKDLIIIRGLNHHPQDLEASLMDAHPALRPGRVVAVGLPGETGERLAILAEVRTDQPIDSESVFAAIRARISEHGLRPEMIGLCPPETIRKTTSGKLQRRAMRDLLYAGDLPLLHRWDAPIANEQEDDLSTAMVEIAEMPESQRRVHVLAVVRQIAAEVLRLRGPDAVPVDASLLGLGLDSLMAVELRGRIEDVFHVVLDTRAVLQTPVPRELVELVLEAIKQPSLRRSISTAARSNEPTLHPLSAAQSRLYFLDRILERRETYNVQIALRIDAILSAERLKKAIAMLVSRHDQLRMHIVEGPEGPEQRILPWVEVPVEVVDLRTGGENSFTQLLRERAAVPFDLAKAPLIRITLAQLSEHSSGLILIWHHIATDGWSVGQLLREIETAYTTPNVQSPVAPSYAEIIAARQLDDHAREEHRRWWMRHLEGVEPLDLPTDHAPARRERRGGALPFTLDSALSDGIDALARTIGATPFVVLLAGWALVLQRYCRQPEVVIGVISSGRTVRGAENTIGLFVETLPLRCAMEGELSVTASIAALRQSLLEALAHERLPLNEILGALSNIRRGDIGETPLLRVSFVLEQASWLLASFAGANAVLVGEAVSGDVEGTNKFDLGLAMVRGAAGYRASIEYAADLFERDTIHRLAGHLRQVLTSMVASPENRLSDMEMLTDAERHHLLVEWPNTTTDYPSHKCIHELFEEQVERSPDAIAVIFGEDLVTYAELNARADQLAHHLRSLGVGPDVLVGLCVERSVEMVVGLLGILKAGGAYVPLDVMYPKERLAFMLKDAEALVVLTQERHRQALPEYARVLCLDSFSNSATSATSAIFNAEEQYAIAVRGARPENLAYVIYTSGSTGTPKGVCVTHRNVVRLVIGTNYIDIRPSDRLAQASNSSFDAATFEIWGALLNGAAVVGVTKEIALSPDEFAAALESQRVSILFTTTALFNMLVRHSPTMFSSLRYVLFGGEAVDPVPVRIALQRAPAHLHHVYGPTETTTFATFYPVHSVPDGAMTIPIGKPIANTTAYVLDARRRVVPIGVPGELYIGGDGVARGYFNRLELTAERFVPDTFSNQPNMRLYKTGDLCRWRADGNLEFLDRLDQQVKIRGFRIELGEIEMALSSHASVRACVVVAREFRPGDKRIVAYVVPNENECSSIVLRAFLAVTLPDYMIPAVFVSLDALPLTPNGKIDRKALPPPEFDRAVLSMRFVAARTRIETTLTHIWADVLGLDFVGIHDNFFELGGNSLLSIRLISRAAKAGLVVTVRQLFESPTIAGLAKAFATNNTSKARCLVPLRPSGSEIPFVLAPGLAGTSMVFLPLRDALRVTMPVWSFDDPHLAQHPAQVDTIEELAHLWVAELLDAVPDAPAFKLGGYSFGGMVAVEMARQLIALGKRVECVFIVDGGLPHDNDVIFDPLAFLETLAKKLGASDADRSGVLESDIEAVLRRVAMALGTQQNSVVDDPITWARAALFTAKKNHQRMIQWQVRPVDVPIIVLHASEAITRVADLGWSNALGHPVQALFVPGDHQTMMEQPFVQTLAFCIEGLLARHDSHAK